MKDQRINKQDEKKREKLNKVVNLVKNSIHRTTKKVNNIIKSI